MKLLGEKQYGLLQEHIQTLYDSLKFNLIINPAADYESVGVAMANREVVMQRHVKYILSQMKPDDKLVLMGHNRHLSKESGLIKDAGAASPGGYKGPSLGTYINHLVPGQVFSIWEIHEQGIGSQPYTELKQEYKGIAGTLNPILSKVAAIYLLRLPEHIFLKRKWYMVGLYNVVYRTPNSQAGRCIFLYQES